MGEQAAIRDCVIDGNSTGVVSSSYAGGVVIEHSTISNNADGVDCRNGPAEACQIVNSLIVNNSVGLERDGQLINSTVVGNGVALRADLSGRFDVINSVVWGNDSLGFLLQTSTFTNSILQDQACSLASTQCVDTVEADPLLVNAPAGDYRLSVGSPAIDAGINAAVEWSTDLDGTPRIVGPAPATVDIGAYEYQPPSTAAGAVTGLSVGKSASDLLLSWNADCGLGDTYDVYRGDLAWGYDSITLDLCGVATQDATIATGAPEGEFFLVVPAWSMQEGSYGSSSSGQRPAALNACYPQGDVDWCAP